MAQRNVGTNWDRSNRNAINSNFNELYSSTGQAIKSAEEAGRQATNASSKASEAQIQANYAKSQGDYAKSVAGSVLLNKNIISDQDGGKVYGWHLKQRDGHVIFAYEEVV